MFLCLAHDVTFLQCVRLLLCQKDEAEANALKVIASNSFSVASRIGVHLDTVVKGSPSPRPSPPGKASAVVGPERRTQALDALRSN